MQGKIATVRSAPLLACMLNFFHHALVVFAFGFQLFLIHGHVLAEDAGLLSTTRLEWNAVLFA